MAGGEKLFPDAEWTQSGSGYAWIADPEAPTSSKLQGTCSVPATAPMLALGKSFLPEMHIYETSHKLKRNDPIESFLQNRSRETLPVNLFEITEERSFDHITDK